jgi:hypothetical protein
MKRRARIKCDVKMSSDVFQDFTISISHIYPKNIIIFQLNVFQQVKYLVCEQQPFFVTMYDGNLMPK